MKKIALLSLILSMTIFGTIGIFVRYIPFPSAFLAASRGIIGSLFVFLFLLITKKGVDVPAIKKNLIPLLLSGAFIGINWILLFESYKHTTVAISTLCYYTAPLMVTVASAFIFREKLTVRKCLCIVMALVGMFFVSGVAEGNIPSSSDLIGILLGIGAAVFYASVTLTTKGLKDISSYDVTLVQLLSAAVVVIPYSLICEQISFSGVGVTAVLLLLLVGVLHTGIAYALFFSSVKTLEAGKVAIFSYLDPIIAIILSVVVLKENMSLLTIVGAVMILLSALLSEIKTTRGDEKK